MTTTLTITSGQASFFSQGYTVLPSPGTAVPDSLVQNILSQAQQAGVTITSSGGSGVTYAPARRFVSTGTGAPTSGSWLLGDEWVDSTGAEFECTAAGSPGTWVAAVGGSSSLPGKDKATGPGGTAGGNTGASKTLGDPTDATTGYDLYSATLSANTTLTLPSPVAGGRFTLRLKQDGTGSRTVTFTGTVAYPAGAVQWLTAANAVNELYLSCPDGVTWEIYPLTGLGPLVPIVKTGAYSAVAGDFVLADATSASFAIAPPTAASGAMFAVKKTDAGTNTVTITGTSEVLATQAATQWFISDGTTWHRLIRSSATDIVATGTPSSSTYLRGDGSWSTPAAGSTYPDGSTTATLVPRPNGYFDIRDSGAKVDMRSSVAASITSGSANLTVTDGAFTSGDIGKSIFVCKAGASSADLVTTISSVTSSTVVVLGTTAGSTISGKTAIWGTDDTTAWRTAIDAAHAQAKSGGSGVVYSPGWSYVGGAVNANSSTFGNAVLSVPSTPVVYSAGSKIPTVRLKGVGGFTESYSTVLPTFSGSGVFCPTAGANANQAVISAGYTATALTFMSTLLEIEDLNIAQPSNTTLGAIDGYATQGLLLLGDVMCVPAVPTADRPTVATSATNGIRFPYVQNGAYSGVAGRVLVLGYYNGMCPSEWFRNSGQILIEGCQRGIQLFGSGGHGMELGRVGLQRNAVHVASSGTINGVTGYIDTEQTVSGAITSYVFDDGPGNITGEIFFHAGNFTFTPAMVNGCAKLKIKSLDVPSGAYTAPSVPSTGTAATKVYRDMAVYVSGGTVTAITVDGVATGLTSGMVIVPAGKTISVSYSVAPTWVWTAI